MSVDIEDVAAVYLYRTYSWTRSWNLSLTIEEDDNFLIDISTYLVG
jgi:hypothetical protein